MAPATPRKGAAKATFAAVVDSAMSETEQPSDRGSVAATWITVTLVLAVFMCGLWVASEWLQRPEPVAPPATDLVP